MDIRKNNIYRLLEYIRPHWHLIVISAVSGVIKMCMPLFIPRVMRYFTDVVLISDIMTVCRKISEILKCLIILLFAYIVIYIPFAFLRQAASEEISNRVTHKIRCRLYEHLLEMSAAFHNIHSSGDLVTRIESDVERVRDFILNIATNVWIDAAMLVIYILPMLSINKVLTLISVILVSFSVIITGKMRLRVKEESRRVQSNISHMVGYMQERMTGYAEVKISNAEEYEKNKFNSLSERIYLYARRANRFHCGGLAVANSMMEITNAIIMCLSVLYIVKGGMTVGDMIVFYTYLGYFITPVRRFTELGANYARSMAGIERVFEILDTPVDIKDNGTISLKHIPMNIDFENVWFSYKEDYVLNNIRFSIKEGQRVAVVGSSGCGKTTLVNLLARFYNTDKGCIRIDNRNINEYSLKSLYENMGMVFQDTILFSGTIYENISYGKPDASCDEIIKAAKNANAYGFIMNMPKGFDTLLGERGTGLSGGQKQRIAIARVFIKDPRLLILDEATSALDSRSEKAVQEALEKLMRGRTSIVIAHRLSTIVNADKIIVMDKGRIAEMGTHKELLKLEGIYKRLYDMQFKDIV